MTDSPNKREAGNRSGTPQKFKPQRPDKRDLLNRRQPAGPPQLQPGGKAPKPGWPLGHRIAFILLLFILGLFLWKQMNPENANHLKISYTKFTELLAENKISNVRVRSTTLFGELTEPMMIGDESMARSATDISVNLGNYDQDLLDQMVDAGIEVTIEPERTWVSLLISTLPWILIFAVWIFILRQMQGGPKGVFSFGKSKAKLMAESQTKVTFVDVAGVEEAKVELQEVIDFLKDPGRFQRLGGKIPKGALLVGPPGTGKTLLARAVAGEAGVPFFSMSGSDFVEMFVGVGASRVRDLFEQGKSSAPCIIFIDEIDAVGRQRGAGIGGGHDEREQTLNQLLVEMDGFESNEGVILLAATNRPDVLDPALLRPGRFDRQIVVDWPDVNAREQILRVHVKNIKVDRNVNLKSVAKGTPGMTGADLANVVNEAALLAARLNRKRVVMADFEEAKDKVMMGTARKTLVITEQEKKLTACHEAGHVLVAKFIPGSDPVHKVSIIARGRALGLTHFLPSDEKHTWSYNYCEAKLASLLGGRAAEHIKFDDVTNGAANDIENATKLARKMVCEWGMSKRLGPLAFGKKDNEVFLGREIATHKDYSEETAVAIDQEVRRFVENALQKAESILQEHVDKLDALTDELLKREILADYQIDKILNSTGRSSGKPPASVSSSAAPESTGEKNETPRKRSSRRRRRKSSDKPQSAVSVADNQQKQDSSVNEQPVKQETQSPESASNQSSADSSSEGEKPKRSRRQPRRRTRKPAQESGSTEKNVAVEGASEAEKKNSTSKKSNSPKDEPPGDSGGDSDSDASFKKRRSRMIRLKIGGRRRTIKKAPAQNIRHIN